MADARSPLSRFSAVTEKARMPARKRKYLRLTAVCPTVLSLVAFALVIIIVISGSKQGVYEDYEMMSFNASQLGQRLVIFSPVNSTTNDPAGTGTGADGGLLGQIGGFFNGVFQNITTAVDTELNKAEASLIKAAIDSIGIQDYYTLHMQKICSGSLSSPNNANATYNITSCVSYEDKLAGLSNVTNSVPSSVQLLTTNISVPILDGVGGSTSYLSDTISTLARAVFAFYIISLIGAGLTAILSILGTLFASFKFITYLALFFSTLGTIFLLAGSIGVTAVASLVSGIVDKIGGGLGLHAEMGNKFVTFTWIAWVLMLLANLYWFMIWFVEVRKRALKLRRRDEDEIGNWWGIWREVKDDWKTD